MSEVLTSQQINKLGNAIIYLSKRVGDLNKTKILKLLFFLEESSIEKYGYPFFGIDFKVWVRGPVIEDVYEDLDQEEPILFGKYIKRASYNNELFVATLEFSDDEFSDNDIQLLDLIVKLSRHQSAKDLVRLSHGRDSLWKKSAVRHGVYEDLLQERVNRTDYLIDFSILLENNEFLKEKYENAIENIKFVNFLKSK